MYNGLELINVMIHGHVDLFAAICLFVLNIIGMGLGPQGVGILSDLFSAEYGNESLRYSLMVFSLVNLWCAYHYYQAAKTLQQDTQRMADAQGAV